jgi:2-oxoglutarate dehydrogenase E1 component
LQQKLDESKAEDRFTDTIAMFEGAWSGLHLASHKEFVKAIDTSVQEEELLAIGNN